MFCVSKAGVSGMPRKSETENVMENRRCAEPKITDKQRSRPSTGPINFKARLDATTKFTPIFARFPLLSDPDPAV
jgi:hypothetical protein